VVVLNETVVALEDSGITVDKLGTAFNVAI
jgi:hypothetical protein